MVKRQKRRMGKTKKLDFEEEEDFKSPSKSKSTIVFSDSDDDAEANEDLSLKIVQKAMTRAFFDAGRSGEDGVVVRKSEGCSGGEDIVVTELVALDSAKKIKKEKKKKKKKVNVVPEEQNAETIEGLEVVKLSEQDDVGNSDNGVLRRLLRGPRYFDPPDSSWGACYNCGEEGHSAVNCKSAKRKKPCFICGSFEHGAKNCQKGKDCFICKQSGHRAKDCPKKFKRCSQGSDLCLKCGSFGHVMSSCNNDYSPNDLKEIQCYVCKSFGHLCCANYFGTAPNKLSCYKCGQLGHTGLACRGSHGETIGERTPASCFNCGQEGHFARECLNSVKACRGSHGESIGEQTPASCFKCGQEGHFARECLNSVKVKKRCHDFSTQKRKASKENKEYKGYKSAPHDLGKPYKRKKILFDEGNIASSSERKAWSGWIMDDPGDFPRGKTIKSRGWQSHSTSIGEDYHTSNLTSGRHYSTYTSPGKFDSPYGRIPSSQRSRNSFDHDHSTSRFSNSSSSRWQRNYDW